MIMRSGRLTLHVHHPYAQGDVRMSMPWWHQGVIYQIYPRSFQDTDGDGIGDLKGIELRLDYLARLGVDAIWISPIYPSPMVDFGYDVADYCDVDPLFGTLEDFDRLLATAHARGLKVILDFVPNHSSDHGSMRAGSPVTIRNATGFCGAILRRAAGRRTTGSATSADRHGPGTRQPDNITITLF